MKCENCGYVREESFAFCPSCGTAAQHGTQETPIVPSNTAAMRVLPALKDALFLVLCILMSVSCAITLLTSGPDVISILFTIFLWLTWSQAQKGIADERHLRCISGTFYANYVITNVIAIIVIVVGVILSLSLNVLLADAAFTAEMAGILDGFAPGLGSRLDGLFAAGLGMLFMVIFVLVGVIILVVNLFSNRYIHRFAKSVYQSIETGTLELKHTKATYGWLWAFGVISGISCLGNFASGDVLLILGSGVACAMPIIAALLLKKYFVTE